MFHAIWGLETYPKYSVPTILHRPLYIGHTCLYPASAWVCYSYRLKTSYLLFSSEIRQLQILAVSSQTSF